MSLKFAELFAVAGDVLQPTQDQALRHLGVDAVTTVLRAGGAVGSDLASPKKHLWVLKLHAASGLSSVFPEESATSAKIAISVENI